VATEVAQAKHAWPLIANGLPRAGLAGAAAASTAAAASASRIPSPPPLGERQARSLTGPAAEIAGLYGNYALLASRGWRLIAAAATTAAGAAPARARFARENAPLYIESVYDAHFALAQIGKKLKDGYLALGGPGAFGAALSAAQVSALERAYSEASDRLHPHVGVRLGS
jgi:hypothetical protein